MAVLGAVTALALGLGAVPAGAATPTLTSNASTATLVGLQIFDNANVIGGANPTGTITFDLYGPGDTTCTTSIFTSTVPVSGNGSYNSQSFTTSQAGTYRWRATYSGDANNTAVGPTACSDPAEQVIVSRALTALSTVASAPVAVTGAIHDTATLGGGLNPTGTITFLLTGPNDLFCSGANAFSATVPVSGNGVYQSPPFTPTAAGTYTWRATYSGDANNLGAGPTACLDPAESVVVAPVAPAPTLTTTASPSTPVGGQINDTATLAGGVLPTGTITFNLYGPGDATCSTAPAFTSTVPVTGNGTYPSPNFTPTAPGTYRWRASYSGDAVNPPVGPTACGDPAETVAISTVVATPLLTTNASAAVAAGGTIHDTATLSGGASPTGSITFNLYGPGDPTCTTAPAFTSTVPVSGNGNYDSGNFTAAQAGTYRWRASYSGDANNSAAGPTACTDPAEDVVVGSAGASLTTVASAPVPVGGQLHDTATLAGGANPTGTITFNLHGPGDPTCTGAPAFTSTVPVTGNGTYASASFTATTPGTHRWRATYSGDANNAPAGPTSCADPAEATVVTPVEAAAPTIATSASLAVPVGGQVHDTAALSGGNSPTGTITFNLYGPGDAGCAGVPAFTATVPVTGNGTYPSPSFTPTAPGTYRWRASYSGDANNFPAGPTPCDDPSEAVLVMSEPPALAVSKTADPPSRPEPGGTFTFTVVVTNSGLPSVTVGSLVDDVYGDLAGRGTCGIGAQLPTGGSYTCSFPGDFTGNAGASQTDTVTASATDATGATASAAASATVRLTDVAPSITVAKTATPSTRPAPGGTFSFGVTVTNPGVEPVTLVGLVDDVHGDLAGKGSCATGATVAPGGGTYSCSFDATFTGQGGQSQTDTVTATAADDEGTQASASAEATVSITSVAPTITVELSADTQTRPEPGGTFSLSVTLTNTSLQALTLVSLTDEDLNGQGTCALPQTLAPGGGRYSCTFPVVFTGNAGDTRTVTVTATATDPQGLTVTAADSVTLTLTDVVPTITVTKTASPSTKPEPGGTFAFSVVVTNTGTEPVTLTGLVDDVHGDLGGKGTCVVGAVLPAGGGQYGCSFTGAFTGRAGDSQTDTVTATATDDEGNAVSATAGATVTLTPPVISIGASVLGLSATVTITPPALGGLVALGVPAAGKPLALTGSDLGGPARFAIALVALGSILVGLAWRWSRAEPALSRGRWVPRSAGRRRPPLRRLLGTRRRWPGRR